MSIRMHQYACMPHGRDYSTNDGGEGGREAESKSWKLKRDEEREEGEYLNVNEFTVPRHKRRPVYKSDNAKRQRWRCCLWIITAICIRTYRESTSKVNVRLLRNFSCGYTRMRCRLNSVSASRRVFLPRVRAHRENHPCHDPVNPIDFISPFAAFARSWYRAKNFPTRYW